MTRFRTSWENSRFRDFYTILFNVLSPLVLVSEVSHNGTSHGIKDFQRLNPLNCAMSETNVFLSYRHIIEKKD